MNETNEVWCDVCGLRLSFSNLTEGLYVGRMHKSGQHSILGFGKAIKKAKRDSTILLNKSKDAICLHSMCDYIGCPDPKNHPKTRSNNLKVKKE